jgi:S-formylglutathione hydrolase FrmB
MALSETRYFSPPLEKMSGLIAIVPDQGDGPFPTVYQLHGLSDDYTVWQRRTRIEQLADKHRVMVVLLDGARSYYINSLLGRYEDHVVDAIRVVERLYPAARDARLRGIGGLSMGGYGAMKIGLKYPGLYASVAAHSGAYDIPRLMRERFSGEAAVLAPKGIDAGDDIFRLAKRPGAKPAIRFDCGVDDFLLADNRLLQEAFLRLGLPHIYEEFPGAHTWDYWDAHLDAALAFHAATFAAAAPAPAKPVPAAPAPAPKPAAKAPEPARKSTRRPESRPGGTHRR